MAAVGGAVTGDGYEQKTLHDELTLPILHIERIRKLAEEAESSKLECIEIGKQVEKLSQMLRSAVRLTASTPSQSLYDRPIRRIVSEVSRNLERTLTLVRRCKHGGFLKHVFSMTTSADFKKVSNLLESSIGDMRWLLSIFDGDGPNLALPPIASNNYPTLAWVWSSIASVMMGKQLSDRIDSVNYLTSLAESSDQNKKMIVEEGAIAPLLKLLKDSGGSPEGQIAAANALSSVADVVERTRAVAAELGIPVIVQALADSPTKVQIAVVGLVAQMAEVDEKAREEFGKENVIRPILSCLMMDLVLGDQSRIIKEGMTSIHSIVQINKELGKNKFLDPHYRKVQSNSSFSSSDGSSRGGIHHRKEKENESPEIKHELKVKCSLALWKLCRGSLLNGRKIAEGRGLQCLSKIIETEKGELQLYCLKTVMEIAEVAELKEDFRKGAWKPSLPPVKAVLSQLLRVIKEESDPDFQISAIKAIGSLARTFPARETQIIGPLVSQLGSRNANVAIEAAMALGKFVRPENYNHVEHSKTIIEFNGVTLLMKMLRLYDSTKTYGLVLLCCISLHVGNSKELEEARVLEYLESPVIRSVVSQNPELRELHMKAIHHLKLYQVGAHPHAHNYAMMELYRIDI
ncbi:hypothetical protein V2J09_015018 [Rumex salicifolius]